MRKLAAFLFRLTGWQGNIPVAIPPKCVLCVAPHTSNWDFYIAMTFYRSIGGLPHFLMKKSWFFFPFNILFKALGGFPVNRSKKTSLTDQMAVELKTRSHFQLAIAPEGTRKRTTEWKTGFIRIAVKGEVPITLVYLDYEKKEIGIFDNYIPTGDIDKDMAIIKSYYKGVKGKHPELFAI